MIAAIDALVEARIDSQGPGVAVAVLHNSTNIHCKGYGLANIEWNCPIMPDTVFRLASITKPFTAIAILMLQEQGKLSITDPITTYFPDYSIHGHNITIEHLLSHTSGLKNYSDLADFNQHWSRIELTPHELIDLFIQEPLDFEPGTCFSYNNSGYALLGLLIETLSGMSYDSFVSTHIFQPLGMMNSYYMKPELLIPHRASGYIQTDQGYQHTPYRSIAVSYAAGGLGSTVKDLSAWDTALRASQLLSSDSLQRMFVPTKLANGKAAEYGLGWFIKKLQGQPVAYHTGGVKGFSTMMMCFLNHAITIILLSNRDKFDALSLATRIGYTLLESRDCSNA